MTSQASAAVSGGFALDAPPVLPVCRRGSEPSFAAELQQVPDSDEPVQTAPPFREMPSARREKTSAGGGAEKKQEDASDADATPLPLPTPSQNTLPLALQLFFNRAEGGREFPATVDGAACAAQTPVLKPEGSLPGSETVSPAAGWSGAIAGASQQQISIDLPAPQSGSERPQSESLEAQPAARLLAADLAVAVRIKEDDTAPAALPRSAETAPAKDVPSKEPRRIQAAEPAAAPSAPRTTAAQPEFWTGGTGVFHPAETPVDTEPEPAPRDIVEVTPVRIETGATRQAASLKDLSLEIQQPNRERVAIRVVERAGEMHVAVRTADGQLASGLRQGLPELVNRIEENGFRAEAWRPAGVVTAATASAETSHDPAASREGTPQQQQSFSDARHEQGGRNQSDRPKWVEELEATRVGDEQSKGEFHGFSR